MKVVMEVLIWSLKWKQKPLLVRSYDASRNCTYGGTRRRQEKEIEKMVEKEQQVAEVQRKTKKAEEDAIKKEKERLKAVAKRRSLLRRSKSNFCRIKRRKKEKPRGKGRRS